jgi:uncharacterized membrane protein
MNLNNLNRFLNRLCGLGKIIVYLFILLIGSLIVFVTSRYLDSNDTGGYLAGRSEESISLIRYSVLFHAIASFLALVFTSTLIFFRIELSFPILHRFAGKTIVFLSLLFIIPTGFILSINALGGNLGKLIFTLLTLLTLISISFGFYFASKRRIELHQKWMLRFFVLLTSAIWLRINLFVCFQVKWVISESDYLWCAVLSWVPQLILLELFFWLTSRKVKT